MMTRITRYLAAYDIRDAKRLAKVAKIMEDFGVRVQESVFEVECSARDLEKLRARIHKTIADEDGVMFAPMCDRDWQRREKYGAAGEHRNVMTGDYMVL